MSKGIHELDATRAALTAALGGQPTADAAADALRSLPHLDDEGRARVARRVYGASILRLRLQWLTGRTDPQAVLEGYMRHEEEGLPSPHPWPEDPRERFLVERGCPAPLADALIASLGLAGADAFVAASNEPGPRTLRTNTLKSDRPSLAATLRAEGIRTRPGALCSGALHVEGKANLFGSRAWRDGLFEVQDEGSQLIAHLCQETPGALVGRTVVDLCAGRGGKTLALAALMADQGSLWVHDVDERALAAQQPRVARAGVHVARRGLCAPASADVVLVDAPCSSSGVLRRSPDLRFSFSPAQVDALGETQRALLTQAATLVRPGGLVVYATCSVLDAENGAVVRDAPTTLTRIDDRLLLPQTEGTDGFFIARFRSTLAAC